LGRHRLAGGWFLHFGLLLRGGAHFGGGQQSVQALEPFGGESAAFWHFRW